MRDAAMEFRIRWVLSGDPELLERWDGQVFYLFDDLLEYTATWVGEDPEVVAWVEAREVPEWSVPHPLSEALFPWHLAPSPIRGEEVER